MSSFLPSQFFSCLTFNAIEEKITNNFCEIFIQPVREIPILDFEEHQLIQKFVPQKIITGEGQPSRFILLCEDDADDQEMLKEVFAAIDESFVLFFVNNGNQILSALDKLNNDQMPCLIILDYNMPGLNGADILRELGSNKRYKNIPKVIWSTAGSEKYKSLCLELGAMDYIIKPNTVEDLEKAVRYMLSICLV